MKPDPPRWFVIVNPQSGRGRGRREFDRIHRLLERARVDARVACTEGPGHAGELARDARDAGFARIAAVGGDGTAHEMVDGLARGDGLARLRDLLLATVPIGTGNDWARSLGMPTRLPAALAQLAQPSECDCDLGRVECAAPEGPRTAHFVNVAGAGFDAFVVERLGERKPGRWSYLIELLRSHRRFRAPTLTVETPGARLRDASLVVFAGIGAYCGGGMQVAPRAELDDGQFEVTLIREMGGARILWELRRLFDASLHDCSRVTAWRAASLAIDSDPPCGIEADGELVGTTPARIEIHPRALRVVHGPARQARLRTV